ncbi:transposase [Streptomyces sp. LN590]|uniref:transposase n=1 Tax=Streptomyces sp. LN590 TaxID=3112980 RepID=UPI00371FCE91
MRGRTSGSSSRAWVAQGELDAVRLGPEGDATAVTAAQLRDVVERLTQAGHWKLGDPEILIVMDSGYDVAYLSHALAGQPVVLVETGFGSRSPGRRSTCSRTNVPCLRVGRQADDGRLHRAVAADKIGCREDGVRPGDDVCLHHRQPSTLQGRKAGLLPALCIRRCVDAEVLALRGPVRPGAEQHAPGAVGDGLAVGPVPEGARRPGHRLPAGAAPVQQDALVHIPGLLAVLIAPVNDRVHAEGPGIARGFRADAPEDRPVVDHLGVVRGLVAAQTGQLPAAAVPVDRRGLLGAVVECLVPGDPHIVRSSRLDVDAASR